MCTANKRCANETRKSYDAAWQRYCKAFDDATSMPEGSEAQSLAAGRMIVAERAFTETRVQHAMTPAGRREIELERDELIRDEGPGSWDAAECQSAINRAELRAELADPAGPWASLGGSR